MHGTFTPSITLGVVGSCNLSLVACVQEKLVDLVTHMHFAHANLSAAVASACARASVGVSSQEEMLGVALEAAVDDGDEKVMQQLMLAALREDRRSLKPHGELIFTCVEKGFAQAVTLFLASGVPGNLCLPSSCITPLHVACRHGAGEASHAMKVVNLLLAGRAEVDARARDGATPLLEACACGHVELAQLLLSNGAIVDRANTRGTTSRSHCAEPGLDFLMCLRASTIASFISGTLKV